MNKNDYKNVLVFIEQRENKIEKVGLELLGKGREIADKLGQDLIAIYLGKEISKEQAENLCFFGADEVIAIENDLLENFQTEPYTETISQIINDIQPSIVFIGASTIGRDLAPRISARVKTGLTADCTILDIDKDSQNLLMTRPAFGGNIMATIICPEHRPQMATIRPGVMVSLEKDKTREVNIKRIKIDLKSNHKYVEILETVEEEQTKKDIQDAEVLISVGRGLNNPKHIEKAKNLAKDLNGMLSSSRALVDEGLVEQAHQVGQTGKNVRPDVYLACGISGAIQHVAGMENSELIIAINNNPDAEIFKYADLGIVGDAKKIIPELSKKLKKIDK